MHRPAVRHDEHGPAGAEGESSRQAGYAVENNLSLAILDRAAFANHTQAGVFRGF